MVENSVRTNIVLEQENINKKIEAKFTYTLGKE